MSLTKMLLFVFVLGVAMAAESKEADVKTTTDASNVVGSLLAAKARTSAVNGTLNATESVNATETVNRRRSIGVDKTEGKRYVFAKSS